MRSGRDELLAELRAYRAADPREEAMREQIVAFIATEEGAFERTTPAGHVTASAWIVDAARTKTVLLHHRKLDRWLQPGGHVDGDPDVRSAAVREAREESGLHTLRLADDSIYDLDVHAIPARGSEGAHLHYDIRFLLEAEPDEPIHASDESHAVRWIALSDLSSYAIDESVRRLADKTCRSLT